MERASAMRTTTATVTRGAFVAATFLAAACGAQSGDAPKPAPMQRDAAELRGQILSLASFAGLADDCSSAELRVFQAGTDQLLKELVGNLETLIVSYGIGTAIDSPEGKALLTATARLETYGPGIPWDVLEGEAPRTFNPVVTSRLPNPETGRCEDIPGLDPLALIVPKVDGWEPPRDSMVYPVVVGYGPEAVNELREWFYERNGGSPDSTLRYVRVTAYAILGDYATVSVVRESERGGTVPLPQFRSGATYLLHKVGSEWRMISYSRIF
jgi:hypothetical protein